MREREREKEMEREREKESELEEIVGFYGEGWRDWKDRKIK